MKRLLPLLLLSLLLTACVSNPAHFSDDQLIFSLRHKSGSEQQAFLEEALARDLIRSDFAEQILARRVAYGMTETEVRASWGTPSAVNDTVIPGRLNRRQLVFRRPHGANYVYLENGLVTAWQTSR